MIALPFITETCYFKLNLGVKMRNSGPKLPPVVVSFVKMIKGSPSYWQKLIDM